MGLGYRRTCIRDGRRVLGYRRFLVRGLWVRPVHDDLVDDLGSVPGADLRDDAIRGVQDPRAGGGVIPSDHLHDRLPGARVREHHRLDVIADHLDHVFDRHLFIPAEAHPETLGKAQVGRRFETLVVHDPSRGTSREASIHDQSPNGMDGVHIRFAHQGAGGLPRLEPPVICGVPEDVGCPGLPVRAVNMGDLDPHRLEVGVVAGDVKPSGVVIIIVKVRVETPISRGVHRVSFGDIQVGVIPLPKVRIVLLHGLGERDTAQVTVSRNFLLDRLQAGGRHDVPGGPPVPIHLRSKDAR